MFRLQVTIMRQTFQYMDMPCHVHVLKCLPDDGSANRNM